MIVSYFCDESSGKDGISSVKPALPVQEPYVSGFFQQHEMKGRQVAMCRTIQHTKPER